MSSALCAAVLVVEMTLASVTGTISNGVNDCTLILGDDGRIYSLSSKPEAVRLGDRVIVEQGTQAPALSGCEQGEYIQWVRMTRPAADGRPETTWMNTEN